MKNYISTFMFFCFIMGYAQNNSSKEILDKFSEIYTKDEEKALDFLYKTNEYYYKNNQENIKKEKEGYHEFIHEIGQYRGYEIFKEEKLSEKVIKYKVLIYHDLFPVFFDLMFYNNSKSWVLYDFKYAKFFGFKELDPKKEESAHPHPH